MKTIFVTGATGFLGYNLCRKLDSAGYTIIACHRNTSQISKLNLLKNIKLFNLEGNNSKLSTIFSDNKIDCVVHCATSYGKNGPPINVLHTNLTLPFEILEYAIKFNVDKFINIDSFTSLFKGYPYLPYYHTSKRNFLEWSETIILNEKIQFCTLRLHHMYGPYDSNKKFTSFVIRELLEKRAEIDLTSGEQKRDFIYVDDVVNVINNLIQTPEIGFKEIEVGTGVSTSIKEMVKLCARIINNDYTKLNFGKLKLRANEVMDVCADTEALDSLRIKIDYNLTDGMKSTIKNIEDRLKSNS